MEIIVISDSHGKQSNIKKILERQIKKPAAVIFLGDGLRDIAYADIEDIPVYSVKGNCDFGIFSDADTPDELLIELGGKKIFMTHGHRYGVKSTLTPLVSMAASKSADILLFGHTHEACEGFLDSENSLGLKIEKPLYIMNPGSIGSYTYQFGIITVDKSGDIMLSHGSLE